MQTESKLEKTAQHYEQIATELEAAAKHLQMTASYFRDNNIPRGCAHAFAAQGYLNHAQNQLGSMAILHAAHSQIEQEQKTLER